MVKALYYTRSNSNCFRASIRVRDPHEYLGKGKDLGINCFLVPANYDGITRGLRHDPMGVPFYNSPIYGKDVIVDVDHIIGGESGIGTGWTMLMECLAAGRGIMLPATSAGGAQTAFKYVSAYSQVRKQFGVEIGNFEGIQEALARIGGGSYYLEAMRQYTVAGIDQNEKPPVITAMAKYNSTETVRKILIDGMDIVGGAGISLGPKNVIGHAYINAPIGVTVEGANILTRSMIVFGQGAIRCHPHVLGQIQAIENNNLSQFDNSFWSHLGHFASNKIRMVVLLLTNGIFATYGGVRPGRYVKQLKRVAAAFAFLADFSMFTLQGKLKQKEMLTGRFADIFSNLYISISILSKFYNEGSKKEDRPFVEWGLSTLLERMHHDLVGIFNNFLVLKPFALILRIFPISTGPSDALTQKVARLMQQDTEQRLRFTKLAYVSDNAEDALNKLEETFKLHHKSKDILKKVKKHIKKGDLPKKQFYYLLDEIKEKKLLTDQEVETLVKLEKDRYEAIEVDSFTLDEYKVH